MEERSKVMQHYKRASQGARSKCEGVGEKGKVGEKLLRIAKVFFS